MLHFKYHIEVPVKCVQEVLYARISCHVYNTRHDFERLANAIKEIEMGPT